jgi:hypothetical protein
MDEIAGVPERTLVLHVIEGALQGFSQRVASIRVNRLSPSIHRTAIIAIILLWACGRSTELNTMTR